MPSIPKRLEQLENTVQSHLIESGAIRADLKWVKKMIWWIVGSSVGTPLVLEVLHHMRGK